MTFFRISLRKMSGENSHCNEENTVKMIQMNVILFFLFFSFFTIHRPSKINCISKTMHITASLRKKGKDSLPPLAWTQQAYGGKESFAWTGNFLKMPHTSKK